MANLFYVDANGQKHQLPVRGAVSSVNGETGVVTLDAEDVGASPPIDDAHASVTNPWSGSKTSSELSAKVDQTTYDAGMAGKQNIPTTQTVTIAAAAWSGQSVTVNVTGVTASNLVQLTCNSKADVDAYAKGGLFCSAQGAGTLTFTCEVTPTTAINLTAVIWG